MVELVRRAVDSASWALASAIVGSAMAFVDATVVNVALPVMQRALGATVGEMQWVVEAYALFLASLVLVGGVLGDRLGRRRVFTIGIVVFAAASVGCGLAPGAASLIGSRAVQGLGAALLVPGSLSLISAAYPDDEERGRAIGTWSAASAMTTAVGPVVGGWLVTHGSWRWVFFLNVPFAAAALVLSRRAPESRDDEARGRIDVLGSALAVIGLGMIVLALVGGPTHSAGTPSVSITLLAAGVACLGSFVVVESRSENPIVPLDLFRSRTFTGTNLLTLLLYGALGGGLFFLPFDLVQIQGYSPAEAGAALLPLVVLLSALGRWSGGLAGRRGARLPLVVGPILAAAGFALLARPGIGGPYLTTFFPGITIVGLGLGVTVAPLTTAVMASVERRHAGVASGVNNAVARAAGLLAVAALGFVFTARYEVELASRSSALPSQARAVLDAERPKLAAADLGSLDSSLQTAARHAIDDAFVASFRTVILVCSALALGGALLAALFVERRRWKPEAPAP
jgi:EmrB/QacA subfamily drug resistance transporter